MPAYAGFLFDWLFDPENEGLKVPPVCQSISELNNISTIIFSHLRTTLMHRLVPYSIMV
jgi:hypothetical protein